MKISKKELKKESEESYKMAKVGVHNPYPLGWRKEMMKSEARMKAL